MCSAAIAQDGKIIAYKESSTPREHAAMATPFVKEVLDDAGLAITDCDAVCVSCGPGSYTGLRVGVSTAKGLCFGAGLPLIGIGTLDVLVSQAISDGLVPDGCAAIVPMIDARRMEVFSAVFSPEGERLTEVEPVIVDETSYSALLSRGTVLFTGDGARKCAGVITDPAAVFSPTDPKAYALAPLAEKAYKEKRFEDIAYFEPFYLKQFTATVSRKGLLQNL